ncbi:hypothetical protein MZK47_14200 [Microbacterium aerolatum]|uniref:hypothetical protein n=1 Tax=Microbacterium aerolatum TaxID=153731 RepID=UPI002000E749|nr:hypothetical protein [Microbacterium aerolatum]MCK3770811.1 hypothetical protein [Microbacterium aerolatum]MCK3770829.1 hypothetical protein [Microbacterium aerolatum]
MEDIGQAGIGVLFWPDGSKRGDQLCVAQVPVTIPEMGGGVDQHCADLPESDLLSFDRRTAGHVQ